MTRYLGGFICVCALGVVPLVGCGDESGTGGTGGVSTVPKIVVIYEYSPWLGLVGKLEGVKICATDTDDCVWTNDAGRATVQIPIDQEFSFTFEKEGYGKELQCGFQPQDVHLFPFLAMQEEGAFFVIHEQVGSPYPMEGTGTLLVIPLDGFLSITATGCVGVAGRTFELSNAEGKRFYIDEDGNWDANLTATSCWGWGGFTEVPPGEVQIEIGGNAKNCQVSDYGWPGTVQNSVRIPVRAGFLTEAWVDCDVLE
jgi:hypothetical protein